MFKVHRKVGNHYRFRHESRSAAFANLAIVVFEPRLEKTGFLHMRKQRSRSASR